MGARQVPISSALEVGARFEQERERLNLSRAELAFAAGYSSEQIRKVEKGERMPGGELLAALLNLTGNIEYVLRGSNPQMGSVRNQEDRQLLDIDSIEAARYLELVRREAREWSRMQSDRRKKVLTDEEADLIEAFRDLSRLQRERALQLLQAVRRGESDLTAPSVSQEAADISLVGDGNRVAGRDFHEGSGDKKK
ncbi:helix-turn-helix transcriptional regulator [Pinirhizobacter sp.]|jgi:transcriptional regulator with XRE-family HTH domain|uniref:helix-turn-helix domain-containing protein n=1 Tax=Pinirhizobacter sp. TaxID=2950432 RepID=UPI002F410D67